MLKIGDRVRIQTQYRTGHNQSLVNGRTGTIIERSYGLTFPYAVKFDEPIVKKRYLITMDRYLESELIKLED